MTLEEGESFIFEATRDFVMATDGGRLAVLQTLPSQQQLGIPTGYPGGDPAIIAVPPTDQYRSNYTILTPDKYLFDFLTLVVPPDAQVLLDGKSLEDNGCSRTRSDGKTPRADLPEPAYYNYRCALSDPQIQLNCELDPSACNIRQDPDQPGGAGPRKGIDPGVQRDGVHRIVADKPVGVLVYGFDSFVSYAYAGGLNLARTVD